MKIIVWRDHFNGLYDRTYGWAAMRAEDHENLDCDTPAGHGATPLEAVGELLWHLDLEDDTPYCMEVTE